MNMKDYTLKELIQATQLKLENLTHKQSDSRIQSIPDIRTIRYYQSLGIVSKPSRYEGREAVYSSHHLEQIVLIKVLQFEGYSLSQIQKRMATVSHSEIHALYRSLSNDSPLEANTHTARPLICVELLPGIQLSIDPNLIKNPEQLIEKLTLALSTEQQ